MIHHVYANQSNVGDWLSARGIQSLLGSHPVREHFCDLPFMPATLAALRTAGPDDLIVIGGGGLFMDYFAPFWEGFRSIAERTPFVIWGVGACALKRQYSRLPSTLLRDIAARARFCIVRDELTREQLGLDALPRPVACPSVVAVPSVDPGTQVLLHVDHYDGIGAANFERLAEITTRFARQTGRSLRRTNNLIERGEHGQLLRVLGLYAAADLVVSSRLHGCILSVAVGRRVLAVSGDHKVESFMRAAGLGDWVVDLTQIDSVEARLAELYRQPMVSEFVERARVENAVVGAAAVAILQHQEVALV